MLHHHISNYVHSIPNLLESFEPSFINTPMAEVKGISIKVTGDLMSFNKKEIDPANDYLKTMTGLESYKLLDPDGWYDTKIYGRFMDIMAENSIIKDFAYVIVGKRIYPRLKKIGALPDNLHTPLENILHEAKGFLENHKGIDVIPRTFLRSNDKDVLVKAPAPGYNSKLYEGVFLGILEMCNVKTGKVEMPEKDLFHITW